MRNPWKDVKDGVQPPLFHLPAAAVTLQALVDHDNGTVVFAVQTVDPISDHLIALWSSSPVPVERYLKALHEAHREFLEQTWEACGPFA
jgi:hypothetical protein